MGGPPAAREVAPAPAELPPPAREERSGLTPAQAAAIAAKATAAAQQPRQEPTEEEKQRRTEYLRKQREILVKKRNEERERQLGEFKAAKQRSAADGTAASRPGSSGGRRLAAELAGGAEGAGPQTIPDEEKAQAAQYMRQALTVQLRQTLTRSMTGNAAPEDQRLP